jgi:hypothetical protein
MTNGKKVSNPVSKPDGCSSTFDWIILFLLIGLAAGGLILWFKFRKSGKFSNCMGAKGEWTKIGKTMVENLLIRIGNGKSPPVTVTKACLDCVIKAAEPKYAPTDFITDLDQMSLEATSILKKCSCGLS